MFNSLYLPGCVSLARRTRTTFIGTEDQFARGTIFICTGDHSVYGGPSLARGTIFNTTGCPLHGGPFLSIPLHGGPFISIRRLPACLPSCLHTLIFLKTHRRFTQKIPCLPRRQSELKSIPLPPQSPTAMSPTPTPRNPSSSSSSSTSSGTASQIPISISRIVPPKTISRSLPGGFCRRSLPSPVLRGRRLTPWPGSRVTPTTNVTVRRAHGRTTTAAMGSRTRTSTPLSKTTTTKPRLRPETCRLRSSSTPNTTSTGPRSRLCASDRSTASMPMNKVSTLYSCVWSVV